MSTLTIVLFVIAVASGSFLVGLKLGTHLEQKRRAHLDRVRREAMKDRVVTSSSLDNPGHSRVRTARFKRVPK